MRKNGSLVAAMLGAMVLVAGSASSAFAQAACGDINNSGLPVNAIDCNSIAQVVSNSGTPVGSHCNGAGTLQCGDMVQDGTIDVGDLVACLQVSVGVPTLLKPCTGFGTPIACNTNVTGAITSNQVWPAGCTTFVNGLVTVENGAVLTIQAGATVEGRKTPTQNGPTSVLVITRDSKINAAGTSVSPIVMTSDTSPSEVKDWGGVVLLGRAPTNFPGGEGNAEGLPPGTAVFGGNNPNDDSGRVVYTRIEFSGAPFGVDNELNVFTQNGIGRATVLDHIQANRGFDDCFEWFGGTVRAKYLVASGCEDDNFDWQIAWRGGLQFGLTVQEAAVGDSGFECDNNEFGENNLPRSNPTICNVTMVGGRRFGGSQGGAGLRLRRGTAGTVSNAILTGWQAGGIRVDDNNTMQNACVAGPALGTSTADLLTVQDTYVYNSGSTGLVQMRPNNGNSPCTSDQLYDLWHTSNGVEPANGAAGVDPLPSLGATYPTAVSNDFFPADEGVADNAPDCQALDPSFFDSAPYLGAFDPNDNPGGNWLVSTGGWISFDTD